MPSTGIAAPLEAGGRWFNSVTALGIGVVGAACGAAVLLFDRATWPPTNVTFARSGSFLLWAFIVVAQSAIWPVALAAIAPDLKELSRHFRKNRREIVESALLLTAVTWACFIASSVIAAFPPYLPRHVLKLTVISAGGWATGTTAAVGIWLVRGALHELCDDAHSIGPGDLQQFLELRRKLQRFLLVTGGIVGLAILGAGAERNMVDAYVTEYGGPSGFPIEDVLVYGLFFSGVLALVYFPTQLTLTRFGERIRDAFCPLPSLADDDWPDKLSKRSTLEGVLSLNEGPGASFKAAVGVLTPLLASLTGLLLNAH